MTLKLDLRSHASRNTLRQTRRRSSDAYGHRDADELTYYGLAYLRSLHEGPDPRYTGC